MSTGSRRAPPRLRRCSSEDVRVGNSGDGGNSRPTGENSRRGHAASVQGKTSDEDVPGRRSGRFRHRDDVRRHRVDDRFDGFALDGATHRPGRDERPRSRCGHRVPRWIPDADRDGCRLRVRGPRSLLASSVGKVHPAKPLRRFHSNVESGCDEEDEKVAVVLLTAPEGPESNVVYGPLGPPILPRVEGRSMTSGGRRH